MSYALDVITAGNITASTLNNSKPLLTLEDVFLNCWMGCLRPPKRKAQPRTSSRFDSTDPISDACRQNTDEANAQRHLGPRACQLIEI